MVPLKFCCIHTTMIKNNHSSYDYIYKKTAIIFDDNYYIYHNKLNK